MFTTIDGLPALEAAGEYRKLAAMKPEPELLATMQRFSSVMSVDPSTWKDCDYSFYGSPIRDQKSFGSCTGQAGVTAMDYLRRKEGEENISLSATFPYAQVNGGRDRGASVSQVLKVLEQIGTCTDAECSTDQIFKNQIQQSAYQTAKKYRVRESFLCRTFEELCEGVNRGFIGACGIRVGQNFNRLNGDGIAPLPDVEIGGHALCVVGLKKWRGNTWLLKIQNSWSARWGLNGFCYLTKGHFDRMVDGYMIQYVLRNNVPIVPTQESNSPEIPDSSPLAIEIQSVPEVCPQLQSVESGQSLLSMLNAVEETTVGATTTPTTPETRRRRRRQRG